MEFNKTQVKIIEKGINNLRKYGYPEASEENILTDFIYSRFFVRMLNDNLGRGFDNDIEELLKYISENQKEFGK